MTSLCAGLWGCSNIDRMSSKMDMAANHLSEPGNVQHEGRIQSVRRIGSMTSIQFHDGAMFDVNDASPLLVNGDTARIYKTPKGLEARLWKAVPDNALPANTSTKQ